jgi:hypothetical protein
MSNLDLSRGNPGGKPRRLALLAAAALALGVGAAGAASATTYFNATASQGSSFTLSDVLFLGFSNNFYDVRFNGQCAACITATAPDASALGVFNFSVGGLPWSYLMDPLIYPQTTTQSATPGYGGYYEHFEGYGDVNLTSGTSAPNLLVSDFNAFSLYAGGSSSIVEFDLDPNYTSSGVLGLPHIPLYLQVSAATTGPVTLTNLTPGRVNPVYTITTPITFDFTLTLTDTSYAASYNAGAGGGGGGGLAGVPEPASWALLLVGFGGMGAVLRRRRAQTQVHAALHG